jgi:uncharacterized protein (DUF1501 family)
MRRISAPEMSRRELLAWLTASAGAASVGGLLLTDVRERSGNPGAATSVPPTSAPAPGDGPPNDGPIRQPAAAGAERVAPIPGARLLVVLEMPGGNDGLSMAVPYGIGAYYDHRPNTAIDAAGVLHIDDEIGLAPELARLHRRGVTVVEGVGAFEPDGSHFEMLARWWSGHSAPPVSSTGWMGRLADVLYDGSAPAVALSIGSGTHPIIRAEQGSTVSIPGGDALDAVVGADPDDPFAVAFQSALARLGQADPNGSESAGRLRGTIDQALAFADRLTRDSSNDESDDDESTSGYTDSGLANSLRFVGEVFAADAGVRVIHVPMDGDFDTHEGHTWRHPSLMADLDANLAAFHDDLDARGLGERVMVMTTSEFGRTIIDNDSGGLDHGTASMLLLSGPGAGGRRGELPSLTKLDNNNDLIATSAFESYLGGVVEGWLGVPATEVFGTDFEPLELGL